MLIGMTGAGKSSTGNSILGATATEEKSRPFKAGCQSTSLTEKSSLVRGLIQGREVAVVDTPGFFDTSVPLDQTVEEVSKCMLLLSPGPHAILLVIKIGRFTSEVLNAVATMQKVFGSDSINHMIIVFTAYDSLLRDDVTIEEYIDDLDDKFKKLVEDCKCRYIPIDNTHKPRSKENFEQVTTLLSLVEDISKTNNGKCYTNEMLKRANQLLEEKREQTEREISENESQREVHLQELRELKEKRDKLGDHTEEVSKSSLAPAQTRQGIQQENQEHKRVKGEDERNNAKATEDESERKTPQRRQSGIESKPIEMLEDTESKLAAVESDKRKMELQIQKLTEENSQLDLKIQALRELYKDKLQMAEAVTSNTTYKSEFSLGDFVRGKGCLVM